jgi:hypothetical protein
VITNINGMEEFMRDGDYPTIKEHRMDCPKYAPRPFLPYYNDADWQKHYGSLECTCFRETVKRAARRRACSFVDCFEWMMNFEDPKQEYAVVGDVGGHSISGINSHYWPAQYSAIEAIPQPDRGVAVEAFYLQNFWIPRYAELANPELGKRVFDFAVNDSRGRSTGTLQAAINALHDPTAGLVVEDGLFGPATIDAANRSIYASLVVMFKELRAAHYLANAAGLPQGVVNVLVARARA